MAVEGNFDISQEFTNLISDVVGGRVAMGHLGLTHRYVGSLSHTLAIAGRVR